MTQPRGRLGYILQGMPPLTTSSLKSMRQQMDEINHDMVNMLTQKIVIMFNSLIRNTNHNYQQLAHKMGRIANFFGAQKMHIQLIPQV